MDTDVSAVAHRANQNRVVQWGARLGYVVVGLMHLLIGWIGVKIAWDIGSSAGQSADKSGALGTMAGSDTGPALLWAAVVGFGMLALWQLTEAAVGYSEAKDRMKALAKSAGYGFFAWSSWKYARGASSSDEQATDDFTASLMEQPAGRLLVAAVGLVVVGIAGYHVHKGWTRRFLHDLREHPGRWAELSGRWGYVAKGAALLVVGGFFVVAAWQADPQEAAGLDGALKAVKDQPFGPGLLTVVAAGIAAYGVYSFARARYARI